MERRTYQTEIRAKDDNTVRGYAAVFNKDSEDLGGFTERIAPGFFDGVLEDDVRALFNHEPNMILGRTKSGTLRLGVDENGLWYEYDNPDTSYSRDLTISLKRGDVSQSSFGFSVKDDSWEEVEGRTIRTLVKADRLFDVSPVTYPAYPDTSVAKRSLEQFQSKDEEVHKDHIERDRELREVEKL